MKLVLYNNFSETNQVDKSISKIIELEGSLLDATSIINPTIKIFFNPETMDGYVVDDNKVYITFNGVKITWDSFIYDYVLAANYAYIPEFNRYYFINDIISVRKNIWQLVMNVDVLMSYKDHILKLDAFIGRNEFNYDVTLADDKLNYYNYYDIKEYDNVGVDDESVNIEFDANPDSLLDDPYRYLFSYMLVGSDDNYSISGTQEAYGPLPPVNAYKFVSGAVYPVITNIRGITDILKRAQTDDIIRGYIYSCIAYPFVIPTDSLSDGEMTFSFGSTDRTITIEHGKVIINPKYLVLATFNVSDYGVEFDYISSISKYELYVPFGGYVQLNYSQIVGKKLSIVYSIINYTTGEGTFYVLNITDNIILTSGQCMLGIKMPLSTTNALEVSNNEQNIMTSLALKTIATTVGAVMGVVAGFATGGASGALMAYGSVVAGTTSLATAGGTAITQLNTNYDRAQIDNIASNGGLYNALTPKLRISKPVPKSDDANYAKFYGRPTKETHKLSELKGFTIVDDIHLENIASASDSEHNMIKSLLKEGIIL